ncbi:MAG: exopolysaccharide Pel transporter PelG [Acetatifactor sp.]|nr:exopolysaccharide Pel transporter PelG [Acetatifactor sp.]
MAGIGVRLNRIFSKNTITTSLIGFGYSMVITVAPMFLVIIAVMVMQALLGFSKIGYADRELYSCTVLYIFIFALLTASPFNAVLSRYMSDEIYNEKFDNIMPCYYVGLIMNEGFSCLVGIPFCIWEYVVGHVEIFYVFMGFCGYISLSLVFYTMLYLSICKDYKKISFFFFIGMLVTVLLSLVLVYWLHVGVSEAMLFSLDVGFIVTSCLEFALIRSYFRENSGKYKEVLRYFKKYWMLMVTNFLYTLGLYIHNFVFWSTDMRMVVVNTFVCMTAYDMATCLAMFTNISSSVLFITRVEMHFHDRYKLYSEAVIGGRGMDIENSKKRMFTQLAEELMNLVRIQFIVSAVVYLIFVTVLPQLGFGGLVIKIYPCLTAGYFILFTMYSAIIFLYYFNDLVGATITALSFCLGTFVGALVATHLSTIWYGIGLVFGSMLGWCMAYHRLRVMEKNLDVHIFCNGNIMERGHGRMPSNKVFDRRLPGKEKGVVKQ